MVLDGELDFSKLDLNRTLKELADRDGGENDVGDEITENDTIMPVFSIEPKFDSDITIVPKEQDFTFHSEEPQEELSSSYGDMESEESMLRPVLIVLGVTFFFLVLILTIDFLMA